MTTLVATILVFVAVAIAFVGGNLALGRLFRPRKPSPQKGEVYECGEQPIGSAWIQFDLRFYVVALLFIIFDVEVAFFFPWAVVFGGARQLADPHLATTTREVLTDRLLDLPAGTTTADTAMSAQDAYQMATIGMLDIFVFFGVLLVGFAYVWKRGDLDWVRAMVNQARASKGLPERNAA